VAREYILNEHGLTNDVVPNAHAITLVKFELPPLMRFAVSHNGCPIVD
jgi:hypothetical protein